MQYGHSYDIFTTAGRIGTESTDRTYTYSTREISSEGFHLERRFLYHEKTSKIQEKIVYGTTRLSREKITLGKLLTLIRSYWGFENGLYYRRDATLRDV